MVGYFCEGEVWKRAGLWRNGWGKVGGSYSVGMGAMIWMVAGWDDIIVLGK